MKICLLSKSDGRGGGFSAAYRLHQALLQTGTDSTMLVGDRSRDDSTVFSPTGPLGRDSSKIASWVDRFPLALYPQREQDIFSLQWFPDGVAARVSEIAPDILNLHWINAGFLQIETLSKFNRPIVWTLHDMWPFTGGCHYSGECDRYTESCGRCPRLGSRHEGDISRWIWQRKARAWKNVNLTAVTPSRWLASIARQSSLFQNVPIEVIPNGLDIQKYQPIDRQLARNQLGLPVDKRLVLFGATSATSDRRKGFHLLQPALGKLGGLMSEKEGLELVVFGASQPIDPPDFGFKTHYLGKIGDDSSLALVYAAADVFVAPSLEDNLPNTVMEALACGTPCVAFSIGGMSDMIEPENNGYLAAPFDVDDFALCIAHVLEDEEKHEKLRERAREKVVQEFTVELQASRYRQLFDRTLDSLRERTKC